MKDLNRCAFLPLDIDLGPIDFNALEQYHNEYSELPRTNMGNNTHGVYVFGLSPVLFRGTEQQFYDQQYCDNNFINRYNILLDDPRYTFNFDKKFPGIVKGISQLPLKITHIEMISNKKDAPPHFDDWEIDGVPDPVWAILTTRSEEQKKQIPDWDIPLNSYKIFLYEKPEPSFYVCENLIGDPVYTKFYKQGYVCCISKLNFPHGVTKLNNIRKYVLSVWGIIDKEKHLDLIKRSYEKNKDYAVFF